jgi:hypothetical protein
LHVVIHVLLPSSSGTRLPHQERSYASGGVVR